MKKKVHAAVQLLLVQEVSFEHIVYHLLFSCYHKNMQCGFSQNTDHMLLQTQWIQ